jgi:AcrR family transcriptional regulator
MMVVVNRPPDLGMRERKKQERRLAIIDAAQTLVAERGLDDVAVEDIAARADISVRTFFNYFDSKVDAVLGLPEEPLDLAAVAAFVAGDGDVLADLLVFLDVTLQRFAADSAHAQRAMALIAAEPQLLQRQFTWMLGHEASLREMFAARLHVDLNDTEPELLIGLAITLFRTSMRAWERGGGSSPNSYLPDSLAGIRRIIETK